MGLAEFQALYRNPQLPDVGQGSVDFTAAWNEVETKLKLEGVADNAMNGAKVAMSDAFDNIAGKLGIDEGQAADAAKKFVLYGKTIVGAVTLVEDMINGARGQSPQAFMGTMLGALTTIGLATGPETAGVGAMLCAAMALIVEAMDAAGMFADKPFLHVGVLPESGYPVTLKPDYVIGGLGMWGSPNEPNTAAWNDFPNPSNPLDAAWFDPNLMGPGPWGKGNNFFGAGDGTAEKQRWGWDATSGHAATVNFYPGIRPIDVAFGGAGGYTVSGPNPADWSQNTYVLTSTYMHVVESGISLPTTGRRRPIVNGFASFYREAWKANKTFALNGLPWQPDWAVLAHSLAIWNRAHDGPQLFIPPQTDGLADAIANARERIASTSSIYGPLLLGSADTLPLNIGDPHGALVAQPPWMGPKRVVKLSGGATVAAVDAVSFEDYRAQLAQVAQDEANAQAAADPGGQQRAIDAINKAFTDASTGVLAQQAAPGPSLGTVATYGALALAAIAIFKPAMLGKLGIRLGGRR